MNILFFVNVITKNRQISRFFRNNALDCICLVFKVINFRQKYIRHCLLGLLRLLLRLIEIRLCGTNWHQLSCVWFYSLFGIAGHPICSICHERSTHSIIPSIDFLLKTSRTQLFDDVFCAICSVKWNTVKSDFTWLSIRVFYCIWAYIASEYWVFS